MLRCIRAGLDSLEQEQHFSVADILTSSCLIKYVTI